MKTIIQLEEQDLERIVLSSLEKHDEKKKREAAENPERPNMTRNKVAKRLHIAHDTVNKMINAGTLETTPDLKFVLTRSVIRYEEGIKTEKPPRRRLSEFKTNNAQKNLNTGTKI